MQMNSLAFHNWTCSPPFPSKATGRGACTLVPGPTPSMLVVGPAPPQPVLQKDHREAALQTPSPAPMNAYSSEGSSPLTRCWSGMDSNIQIGNGFVGSSELGRSTGGPVI